MPCFFSNSYSQTIPFQSYGLENGLLDERCYDITQDSNGFIWIGTNSGLTRFDGINFRSYRIDNKSDIDVYRIAVQKDRLVLITEHNGIYILENGSISEMESHKALRKQLNEMAYTQTEFAQDKDGNLWLGYHVKENEAFFFIKIDTNDVHEQYHVPAKENVISYAKIFEGGGSTYSSRKKKTNQPEVIVEYQVVKKTFKIRSFSNFEYSSIFALTAFDTNTIAININNKSIVIKNGKEKEIISNRMTQRGGMFFENDSTLWLGYMKHPSQQVKLIASQDGFRVKSYEFENLIDVTNFNKDSQGRLWFTSGSTGIHVSLPIEVIECEDMTDVVDFTFHNNELYTVDEKGNIKIHKDRESKTLTHLNNFPNQLFSFNDTLLVVAPIKGDRVLSNEKFQIVKSFGQKHLLIRDSVFYANSRDGANIFNQQGVSFSFNDPKANGVFIINENTLLMNKEGFIYQVQFENDKVINQRKLNPQANAFDLMLSQTDDAFYSDTSGSFFRIFKNGEVKKLIDKHPAFKENIRQILSDSLGLCIVFSNYILRIDENYELTYLMRSPRIFKGEFKRLEYRAGNYYWLSGGRIYKSSNPFDNSKNFNYPIYIESKGKKIEASSEIIRRHSENSVIISCSSFDFDKVPYNRQAVELISEQSSVLYEANDNAIFLADLAFGKHKIKIFNYNRITGERSETTEVSVTIEEPFWNKWWFWGLIFVIGIVGSSSIVLYRNKIELEKERLINQLNRMRAKAVSSQLKPHFIFNALGSIQFLIESQKRENAIDYLTRFARLLRIVLEYSDEDWYTLEKEIEIVNLYISIESLRFNKPISIEFKNHTSLKEQDILIPPLMLQLLAENAVIHGIRHIPGEGKVKISFDELSNNQIEIRVLDNGIGFEHALNQPKKNKKSLGLSLIRDRLDIISRTEKVKCHLKYGTYTESSAYKSYVRLILPIKKKPKHVKDNNS